MLLLLSPPKAEAAAVAGGAVEVSLRVALPGGPVAEGAGWGAGLNQSVMGADCAVVATISTCEHCANKDLYNVCLADCEPEMVCTAAG